MGDDYESKDGGSRAGKFGGLSWNKKPRRRSGAAASGNDSSKIQPAKVESRMPRLRLTKNYARLCAGGRLEYFQDVSI